MNLQVDCDNWNCLKWSYKVFSQNNQDSMGKKTLFYYFYG